MRISKGTKLLILGLLLVIIDQIIKVLVKTNMAIGEHFSVIGNWFQIFFIENEGMAFGMKFGGQVGKFLLSLFRIILFGALVYWIRGLLKKPETPVGVVVGLTLITAGALGNIIDCLFYGLLFSESTYTAVAQFLPEGGGYAPFFFGKVVDMFYFPIIDTTFLQFCRQLRHLRRNIPDFLPVAIFCQGQQTGRSRSPKEKRQTLKIKTALMNCTLKFDTISGCSSFIINSVELFVLLLFFHLNI